MDQPSKSNPEFQTAHPRSHPILQKYLLFQIPGIALVGLLLLGLERAEWLSWGSAAVLWIAWCIKDALMYRVVWPAYAPGPPNGTAALVGLRGRVVDDLNPVGSVRLGAELWSARPAAGGSSFRRGTWVRVVSVEGFVLTVVDGRNA